MVFMNHTAVNSGLAFVCHYCQLRSSGVPEYQLARSGTSPQVSGADRVYVSLGTAGTYPGYGPVYRNVPW